MKTLDEINQIGIQAKAGDEQALVLLFEQMSNYFTSWQKINITSTEFNKQLVNDSLQNLFICIKNNIQNWDIEKGNVRTYFYQFFKQVYNKTFEQNSGITTYFRKNFGTVTSINGLECAEEIMIDYLKKVENKIDFQLLKKRLDKVAKKMFSNVDYQVFILYFFEEKNSIEIAKIINKSHQRVAQILKKIKEKMYENNNFRLPAR